MALDDLPFDIKQLLLAFKNLFQHLLESDPCLVRLLVRQGIQRQFFVHFLESDSLPKCFLVELVHDVTMVLRHVVARKMSELVDKLEADCARLFLRSFDFLALRKFDMLLRVLTDL